MSFESAEFGLLVLATLAAYWGLRAWRAGQKLVLLGASVGFYGMFGWKFVAVLAASILANYAFGRLIQAGTFKHSTTVGVAANLALLGVFKYYDFFRESLDDALGRLGLSSHLPAFEILLPVGISFYTFQAIAYLIDVRRNPEGAARSLLDFALFQSLFVQLLMGPICRATDLLRQIAAPGPAGPLRVEEAMSLILTGLMKRMILASALFSHGVAEAFFAPDNYAAATLWMTLMGYSVQLYCVFSGYTDLMRGVGLLLGFEIPENFNNPYVATSVGDFWRRWHITFSNWLRDFIYLPLGGSRTPRPRTYLNLFATMFVCGLWHGASWGFIIWGSLHGAALVVHKAGLDRMRDRGIDPKMREAAPLDALRGWLWTMGVVCFSRIFFVAPDLQTAANYLQRLFSPLAEGAGFDHVLVAATAVGLAWNFVGDRARTRFVGFTQALGRPAQVAVWALALLLLALARPGGVSPNAYFGF